MISFTKKITEFSSKKDSFLTGRVWKKTGTAFRFKISEKFVDLYAISSSYIIFNYIFISLFGKLFFGMIEQGSSLKPYQDFRLNIGLFLIKPISITTDLKRSQIFPSLGS